MAVPKWPQPQALAGQESPPCPERARYRILKIAPTSFFADYGCHVRILEETLALQGLGSQVTICTYPSGRDLPGVDIRRTLSIPWQNGVQVGSSLHKIYFDALLSLQSLWASFAVRPDLVHAHLHEGALIGNALSCLHRVPLVFDFQGSLTSEMIDHNFLRRDSVWFEPLRRLETHINRMADAIITSSHHAAGVLRQEFGYPAAKIHPVPDGVNIYRFRPKWEVEPGLIAQLKRQLGLPLEGKVVVYLGLLAEYQGSSYLLRAAADLLRRRHEVHFLLMGYPGQQRYQALARDLGIEDRVTFTGRLPYERAPLYLALGDVAVSPKISETEGNGKLLNYMAVGLPTVTFDTPVSREILGELGVYAGTANPQALAAALESLLFGSEADALGRRLRERAERHYSWEILGRKLLEVYRQVCR